MDNVASFGKGSRPLVIIPGLSLTKVVTNVFLLKRIFKQFTDDWTVYVIDRPDSVPEGTTNKDLADYYAATLISLGLRDADIVGASQGGMIAQHIAVDHPELVHFMVLAASLSRLNATAQEVLDHWLKLAEEEKWYELNIDSFNRLYTDNYLKKNAMAVKAAARMVKPADKEQFIRLVKACLTGGPYDALSCIKCPVLVMGSEDDPVVTGDASREIASALGCEIVMYTGYRHAVYDENKEFYDRVREFLEVSSSIRK